MFPYYTLLRQSLLRFPRLPFGIRPAPSYQMMANIVCHQNVLLTSWPWATLTNSYFLTLTHSSSLYILILPRPARQPPLRPAELTPEGFLLTLLRVSYSPPTFANPSPSAAARCMAPPPLPCLPLKGSRRLFLPLLALFNRICTPTSPIRYHRLRYFLSPL